MDNIDILRRFGITEDNESMALFSLTHRSMINNEQYESNSNLLYHYSEVGATIFSLVLKLYIKEMYSSETNLL